MDFMEIMKIIGFAVSTFVIYRLFVHEQKDKTKGHYTRPAWNYFLKKIYAEYKVKQKQKSDKLKFIKRIKQYETEAPKILPTEESSDSQLISGNDDKGNSLLIKFTRRRHRMAEVWLVLRLANGQVYTLPDHPNTTIANVTPRIFEGAGLKLECLESFIKWRVTFSGMLRKGIAQEPSVNEKNLFFSRFNFIWITASDPKYWPYDWSSKLIAKSLATEKWRDGKWMNLLIQKDHGGYDQFGSCHGQGKIYDNDASAYVEGMLPKVEEFELNLPGIRQRRWGPTKSGHLHRTGVIIGSIKDGCAFEVGALSGKYGLTQTQFGNLRFPDGRVLPIESTNFDLAVLGENQSKLPQATVINMEAEGKKFVAMISFKNKAKVPLNGGAQKDSWNAFIIPVEIRFNNIIGHGSAIFWYPKIHQEFDVQEIPSTIRRIFNRNDAASPTQLVLSFADKESQSVLVSGGKGSSIAILRAIQETKAEDFLDKSNRSQQILNALVDTVSTNPLKRSIRVQSLLNKQEQSEGQPAGSIAKSIFPDPLDFDVPDFFVPQGFIVSVSAFDRHVENNQEIGKALMKLKDLAYEKTEGSLKDVCASVQKAFHATKLDTKMTELISKRLEQINFDGSARFAVRSSGVTEDCEESSAAGQNETFLGLRTKEDVFEAVVKCWASLYGYQSVQYRKQHIQPVKTSMAVVIQKMVPAEAAGVLFTRHPINGDSSITVITANFGLGESVVSAKAEPDTFFVKRSHIDELQFVGAKAGAKKMLIQMDSGTSVREVQLDEAQRNQLCLSKEIVVKLAKLGVVMERFFGTPRDLEFAVTKDQKIFLLQSRPITALNNFTDFEIIHENDTAVMSQNDCFTKANVGEVILGPTSTFTQSTLLLMFEKLVYESLTASPRSASSNHNIFFTFSHQNLFMDVGATFLSNLGPKVKMTDRISSTSLFGCDIYEKYPSLSELANHRNSFRGSKTIAPLLLLYKIFFKMQSYMNTMDDACDKVKDQFTAENIRKLTSLNDIWEKILRGLDDVMIVAQVHMLASNSSTVSQAFSFSALGSGSETLTIEHQNDISTILGSISDVESANVPEMIQEIAGRIMILKKHEEFLNIDSKKAAEWLEVHLPEAYQLFKGFMNRHGHRSINELDFISKPWSDQPELIINMIKTNLRVPTGSNHSTASNRKPSTVEEIMANVKTPLGMISSFIIRKLLPKCKQGVQHRENCKSKLVLVINRVRQAVNYLGERMVQEGFLPDKSLIYHLSKNEVTDLILTRDARIVTKTIRRSKMFEKLKELKFAEISFGNPKPLTQRFNENALKGDVLVTGVPVCSGIVTANACVCKSFADAGNLKKGDILVTYGTDVGWSPYFPILSGVVTEIGGLISHGAVVAREYGLPCLVGATSATDLIRNGQQITLNANEGKISAAE